MAGQHSGGNRDYHWDAFDSESYLDHYYEELHADDAELARLTARALAEASPPGALSILDVGTGPNLFPWLCALPRARSLTAWEYSRGNVDWLEAELRAAPRPLWSRYWDIVCDAIGGGDLPEAPLPAIAPIAQVVQGSVFDLPERRWDAATMFFCAESITRDEAEFARACGCFARAVRPGGMLVAAFLSGSQGYEVAARPFPALPVTAETITRTFAPFADTVTVRRVGGSDTETHSGYSGALFLTARAR